MRGRTEEQAELFHVFNVEERIRADHPLANPALLYPCHPLTNH